MPPYLIPVLLLIAGASALAILFRSRQRRSERPLDSAGPPAPVTVNKLKPGGELHFDPEATQIFLKTATNAPIKRTGGHAIADTRVRLVSLSGALKNSSFDITDRGLTIGRRSDCDIQLADRRVSARHAWIGIVDDKIVLRDLKSTNGTFVNANMNTPIHEANLAPGDTVLLGGHLGDQFLLRTEAQP